MWSIFISAIFSLLEKVGLRWWGERKVEKADEAQNKVLSLSDAELTKRVHDDITRR